MSRRLITISSILVVIIAWEIPPLSVAAAPIGLPGCETTCGDVRVPYPFGIGGGCYHSPGFNLTCDRTGSSSTTTPPRLLLGDGTLRVTCIDGSHLRVIRNGDIEIGADGCGTWLISGGLADDGPHKLDPVKNELIVTGCNVQATLKNGDVTIASCSSLCRSSNPGDVPSRLKSSMPCSGVGCCQADIVDEVAGELVHRAAYDVELKWLGRNSTADQEFPAGVLVAEQGWFEQAARPVSDELKIYPPPRHPSRSAMEIPVLLMWDISGPSSSQCSRLLCKSNHSECVNGLHGTGRHACSCVRGYHGNPYVIHGCQDINECDVEESIRSCNGECINTEGSYECRHNSTAPNGSGAGAGASSRCNRSCGDVAVPYPFGISSGCYFPGFELRCDTSHSPPRLLLGDDMSLRVVDISIPNNTVRVLRTGALISTADNDTSTAGGGEFDFGDVFTDHFNLHTIVPYSLSSRNELIVMGCNVKATLDGHTDPRIISGCASFCSASARPNGKEYVDDKHCHGTGCCQAPISMSMDGMPRMLWLDRFDRNHVHAVEELAPACAFIAEEGWFDLRNFSAGHSIHRQEVPFLLQWEILLLSAQRLEPQQQQSNCPALGSDTICNSTHSHCRAGNRGYSCHRNDGYHGNPYLVDGCQSHPKHFKGLSAVIGAASGMGLVLLVLVAFFVYGKYKNRRAQMLKRKFFERNRGQLLQQLVSQRADIAERMIIPLEELEKATNNFDKARQLGGGGHGTVYKGILSDLHVVAIKKPNKVVQPEADEFVNEVAILSQINHRNVVKLYGCCLETEVPLLVYEFISNGTLYGHLHVDGPISLTWSHRLRIATEIAKSLAYLHSTALVPIIHRDIKSVNILLDDTLTAKVADFGASRYISIEKSGLTTKVQGTIGYLDPMYFYTGRLMDKSDVYSFGVMLVELLTRKKPFSYQSSEGNGLVVHFSALFAEGNLSHILDPQVMDKGSEEVKEVASLAVTCIKLKGGDRPTMREVELALESIWSQKKHVLENVVIINHSLNLHGRGNEESSRQHSMEKEFALSASYPR